MDHRSTRRTPDSDTIHSVIGVRRASQTSGIRWGAFVFLVGVALSLTVCPSGPSFLQRPIATDSGSITS